LLHDIVSQAMKAVDIDGFFFVLSEPDVLS